MARRKRDASDTEETTLSATVVLDGPTVEEKRADIERLVGLGARVAEAAYLAGADEDVSREEILQRQEVWLKWHTPAVLDVESQLGNDDKAAELHNGE